MKRDFNDIIIKLKRTVANYNYYTDFEKVKRNIKKINIELNILNSLIGSENIEDDFIEILNDYPKTLRVIPILLAIRYIEVPILDNETIIFDFKNKNQSGELFCKFMRNSGLFDMLENKYINNLVDYVTGVEVGLDSNARKNRTGKAMEDIVESFVAKTNHIEYHKEMKKSIINDKYCINLDNLIFSENPEKAAEKRFDFVIKTENHLYLIETNFYSGGGSKLNSTAGRFKSIANDIKSIEGVTFIWITDGIGWNSAKNNLKETYGILENLYTLEDLEKGVLNTIVK